MQPIMERLVDSLKGSRPTLAIVGLGYVGLPLAMAMTESGAKVIGIDVEPSRCARLNEGSSYIDDVDDADWKALAGDRGGFRSRRTTASSRRPTRSACADALHQTKDPDICTPRRPR
jgi:UDP-N-acetyl-D-mannosaminuronate dehydrogenase